MHIAAAMAALRVRDLDPMAKHALLVVCCRASQHTAAVTVSSSRVAKDMGRSRPTAAAALGRGVEAGYLTVDKCLGKTSRWRIDLSKLGALPVKQLLTGPVKQLLTTEDSLDVKRGEGERAAPVNINGRKPLAFAPGSGFLPNWSLGEE